MTDLAAIAQKLTTELMPLGVLTAGEAAGPLADAFKALGANAEVFSANASPGADLAILRADPEVLDIPAARASLNRLATISQRLLFWPSGDGQDGAALMTWFEVLADLGFQPVVDFDASFVAQGAFLVDRDATAAEAELDAFMQRLTMGGALAATTTRVAALEAELGDVGDRAKLKASLNARETALSARNEELSDLHAKLAALEAQIASERAVRAEEQAVMGRLAEWIRSACLHPARFAGPHLGLFASSASKDIARGAAAVRARPGYDPVSIILAHPSLPQAGEDPARFVAHPKKK